MSDQESRATESSIDGFDSTNLSLFYFVREVEVGRVLEMGRRFTSGAGWACVMAGVGLCFGVVMTINVSQAVRLCGWGVMAAAAVIAFLYGRRFLRGTRYRLDRSRQVIEIECPIGRVMAAIPFAEVDAVQLVLKRGSPAARTSVVRWTLLTVTHGEKTETILRSFVSHKRTDAPDDDETVRALKPLAEILAEWIGAELLPVKSELA